jgi:hypothetical protein
MRQSALKDKGRAESRRRLPTVSAESLLTERRRSKLSDRYSFHTIFTWIGEW